MIVKSYSTKVSTGNLIRHLKEEHQLLSDDKARTLLDIKSFFSPNPCPGTSRSNLNKPTKWILARDLALWLCRSLLPFDSVSDDALIDFLKKYNIILTAEDLPTRTTISRNAVDDIYECMLAHIKKTFQTSITGHAAITTDLWSDCYKRNNYITMTLHFINELFVLENVTLITELIEGPKTAEKISAFIQKTLQNFELQNKYLFLVSDAGANVRKAASLLSEQIMCENHLCLGHGLHNLVVVDGIKSTPNINSLVIKCKSIVQALRFKLPELAALADQEQRKILNSVEDAGQVIDNDENIGLDLEETENDNEIETEECSEARGQLPKSVVSIKNATPTRWHSTLIMLESLYNKYNQVPINQLLEKLHKEDLKVTESEWLLMKYLIDFLAKFRECVTIMSAQKSCTINVALVYKMELAEIINSLDDNEPLEIFRMKKNMKAKLDQRLPTNDLTVAATLLDCRFQAIHEVDKYLKLHGQDRVSFLASYTRRIVKKEHLCNNIQTSSPATMTNSAEVECSSSSRLLQLSLKYGARIDRHSAEEDSDDSIETECWKYIAGCDPRDYATSDLDILKYWKDRQVSFPYLSTLAKGILSIPATSTPSERVFSVAGLTLTAKRSRLSGRNVNKIIFIHDNYEKCKQSVQDTTK